MSEKKSWGDTVLGLFVVRDDADVDPPRQGSDSDADALIAKYAAQDPPAAPSPVEPKGPVPLPTSVSAQDGETLDLAAVYQAAGIAEAAQERVTRAVELLKTLPAETPRELKRTIVEASLKAFGLPVDEIISAGVSEIQALQAYSQLGQKGTQQALTECNERLAALEKEMNDVRRLMERKAAAQGELERQCNAARLRVQDVLEFFGQEAVARVVQSIPGKPDGA